ncbi:hypothetical protein MUO14_03540 [Halobacillus shinanisalinarum]|uniref:Type VII secretion protein EssB n=1 Tax=Halobacillus shinanisalinarum TaxID=2932258 RepID=A0ABY4H2A2_9BACI|nr:hypothetical protein [Halobacillus shinanisalinarum]UOQ94055.1 hypothetical protein MUO14_03540 [Halobacillus shinanisalinarum]
MRVLFTSKIDGDINSFQPYLFQEAVEKTEELDTKWKKKNAEPVPLDFMISNDEGDKLYNGTYVVGSEETTNIYDHVCRKLIQMPMNHKQQETERDILLQNLTAHTPTTYQLDVTEHLKEDRLNQTGWKTLSKRQKIMTGSFAGLVIVMIVMSVALVFMLRSQSQAMQQMDQELNEVKATKNVYETAVTGDITEAIDKLQAQRKLSDSEHEALIHFHLSKKNYEEAIKEAGKEQTSFLADQIMQLHGVGELQTFQESYPSPAGAFEIAYHSEAYEETIAVEDVPMTTERYKEKGMAYLKLDQLEEAKKMASEAKSDGLNEKISSYEQLEQKITQINSQIKTEKQSDQKDQDKIKEWEEQKSELQNKQNNL